MVAGCWAERDKIVLDASEAACGGLDYGLAECDSSELGWSGKVGLGCVEVVIVEGAVVDFQQSGNVDLLAVWVHLV